MDLGDMVILYISFKMGATVQGVYSSEEFVRGMTALGCVASIFLCFPFADLLGTLGACSSGRPCAVPVSSNALSTAGLHASLLPVARPAFAKCRVNTVAQLKAKLPTLRAQMATPAESNALHTWAYVFNCEPGQRSVTLDVAKGEWPALAGEAGCVDTHTPQCVPPWSLLRHHPVA